MSAAVRSTLEVKMCILMSLNVSFVPKTVSVVELFTIEFHSFQDTTVHHWSGTKIPSAFLENVLKESKGGLFALD